MTDLERQMRQVAAQYGAECWQLREPAIVLIEGGARQVLPAWLLGGDQGRRADRDRLPQHQHLELMRIAELARQGLIAVPDRVHGTANGYNNYACRCPSCTTAWADHIRERRRLKKLNAVKVVKE